jgi:CheY-like chemotaxis protein
MSISQVQLKILVVDDSLVKRRMAKGFLERAGHTVIEAEHTDDGLAKLKEHRDIGLVVVDFQMPNEHGGNGGRFARKALCSYPWIQLILHSTNVGTNDGELEKFRSLFHRQTSQAANLPKLVEELSVA